MKRKVFLNILLIFCTCSLLFAAYTEEDLVSLMKTNSASVKSSELGVSKARLERQKAIGDFLPKIDYNATAAYIGNPLGPINISADSIIAAIDMPAGTIGNLKPGTYVPVYGGMENSYYSFSLQLTQPIITWGKLTKQYEIYDSLLNIEENKHALKLRKDEAEIRTRSASFAYLNELEVTLENAIKDANELSGLVEKTKNDGMTTEEDRLKILSTIARLENAYINADTTKQTQVESLGLLVGVYDLSEKDLNLTYPDIEMYKELLETKSEISMVAAAVAPSKETIKMLDRGVKVAEDKRYVSYASMLYAPDIGLMASLSYGGSRFPFVEKGWSSKDDWNAIIALRMQGTLFDGTKQWANLSESKEDVENAKLQKETSVQTIINAVKSTRRSLELSLSSIKYKESVYNEKKEAFRIASEKYENRQISRIEYLTASLEEKGAEADVYTEYIKANTLYNTLNFLI